MNKLMIVLFSLIMTTSAYAHDEAKSKLVFGKKCTVNKEGIIITSYVWKVEKNSDWQNVINKENCNK